MPIRFQVDGDFYDHPKAIGLSDAATALWVRAGSYSTAKLLDGFVPEDALVLCSRTPEDAAGELVKRGLWRRVKGGFSFHQWGERNLTRERVEDYKARDRERKQEDRRHRRVTHDVTCQLCGHGFVTARSDAKYCSTACRKRASRNANPQVGTQVVRSDSDVDSERNPNGIRPVSVSVSVSESVSGSGQAAPSARASPPEPPRNCPEHLDNPDPPPCGRCADARRTHDRWEAQRAARIAAAPKCRRHRGQPADNCALCRSERLAPPEDAA